MDSEFIFGQSMLAHIVNLMPPIGPKETFMFMRVISTNT